MCEHMHTITPLLQYQMREPIACWGIGVAIKCNTFNDVGYLRALLCKYSIKLVCVSLWCKPQHVADKLMLHPMNLHAGRCKVDFVPTGSLTQSSFKSMSPKQYSCSGLGVARSMNNAQGACTFFISHWYSHLVSQSQAACTPNVCQLGRLLWICIGRFRISSHTPHHDVEMLMSQQTFKCTTRYARSNWHVRIHIKRVAV